MNERTDLLQLFKKEILEQAKYKNRFTGMGGYGERFAPHRERYRSLPVSERSIYEEAILSLVRDPDREKSLVGLLLCGDLKCYHLAPPDWDDRVRTVVEALIEQKGIPTDEGPRFVYADHLVVTAYVFDIKGVVAEIQSYGRHIIEEFRSGKIELVDFVLLYGTVIRGLVYLSPKLALEELDWFIRQDDLVQRLEGRTRSVLRSWIFYGMEKYGVEWSEDFLRVVKGGSAKIRRTSLEAMEESLDTLEHWDRERPIAPEVRERALAFARRELEAFDSSMD